MTEEKAKKKWCPMVRAGNEAGCNKNYILNEEDDITCCVASKCMWWVWDFKQDSECKGSGHCGAIK